MRSRWSCIAALAGGIVVGAAAPAGAQVTGCPHREGSDPSARPSPLDSVMFTVAGRDVKVCYGRPSARGRTMIGGDLVPYGEVWRTGANETTKLMSSTALRVGGIDVPAGMYALYTVPGESEWQIIVNRAHEQWGAERTYTEEVKAQELGRTAVKAEHVEDHIETFTIRAEPQANGTASLVLEWEHTRVRVPITARK